jgi:hypothetical protein
MEGLALQLQARYGGRRLSASQAQAVALALDEKLVLVSVPLLASSSKRRRRSSRW